MYDDERDVECSLQTPPVLNELSHSLIFSNVLFICRLDLSAMFSIVKTLARACNPYRGLAMYSHWC